MVYSFLFYSIILLCSTVLTLIIKDAEIHDLVSNDPAIFAADAALWVAEGNLVTPLHKLCGTTLLLGGDGVLGKYAYFKRTYTDLPKHGGISGQISFWLIDKWREIDDMIFLRIYDEVSTNIFYNRILGVEYDANWDASVCGDNTLRDLKDVKFNFRFSHYTDTVTFQIYSTHPMDANKASFGIRDVKLLLHQDKASPVYVCARHASSSVDWMSGAQCDCPSGQYGSLCLPCGSADAACYSSGNPYVCKPNAALYADDPSNCYCDFCDSSCATCSYPSSETDCLTCVGSRFLFKNGTCLVNCPYTQTTLNGIPHCDFTCLSLTTTEYLYPNGSCIDSCTLPYVTRDVNIGIHCDFPCAPSGYSFPDYVCRSSCDDPMIIRVEPFDIKYCLPPCVDGYYYYPDERTCKNTCPYPRQLKKSQFYLYCEDSSGIAKTFASLTSLMNGKAGEIVNKGALAISFVFIGQSFGIMVASYTRLFQDIRYINVNFATHAEIMIENWQHSLMTLEFFPAAPEGMAEEIPQNIVLSIFERYQIHTSFLVSCWRSVMSILTMLVALVLLRAVEWMVSPSQQASTIGSIIKSLRLLVQNAFIIVLYGNFGYIILYAILEYRSLNLGASSLSVLSFILSMAFIGFICVTLVLHVLFLRRRRRVVEKADWSENLTELKEFTIRNAGLRVLFHDFKDKYQSYLALFMLRDITCNFLVVTLTNFPLHQTGAMSIFSLVWLFYLYSNRPFKRLPDQIQQLFCEVLLLVANSSAFVTAVLDDVENDDVNLREYLAKAIMFTTMVFSYSVFAFFGMKSAMMIYDIYKIKNAPKNPNQGANSSGIIGNLLGLNEDAYEKEEEDKSLSQESRLDTKTLAKLEKAKSKKMRKSGYNESRPLDTINEYYRRRELVMDSKNLRVHVGRFGKANPLESKDQSDYNDSNSHSNRKKKSRKNQDSFEGEISLEKDNRKYISELKPKAAEPRNKLFSIPETELRCREKDVFEAQRE